MTRRIVKLPHPHGELEMQVSSATAVEKGNQYRVRIEYRGRRFTTTYWQGSAWPVNEVLSKDVLSSLEVDYHSDTTTGFEDWAREYGYDTDSRKAEATFNTIVKQQQQLIKLFGSAEATEQILSHFRED